MAAPTRPCPSPNSWGKKRDMFLWPRGRATNIPFSSLVICGQTHPGGGSSTTFSLAAHHHFPRKHRSRRCPQLLPPLPSPRTSPLQLVVIHRQHGSYSFTVYDRIRHSLDLNHRVLHPQSRRSPLYQSARPSLRRSQPEPSLLSTGRSLAIPRLLTLWPVCHPNFKQLFELIFPQRSPHDVALPSSPQPSVFMSVSIANRNPESRRFIANRPRFFPSLLARSSHTMSTNSSHISTTLTTSVTHNTRSLPVTCVQSKKRCWIFPICCAGGKPKFTSTFQNPALRSVRKLSQGCWMMSLLKFR